ncbi:serine hydrolase domain-containing protein [Microbacterium sp. PMB16]|uniref:serine hydrolase domain-containing protein n=1 Tax=Microbacterium sp. PMB16 TaxID=3120157 RepID=UPI003F4C2E3A
MTITTDNVEDAYAPVRTLFADYLAAEPAYSAQLVVFRHGEPVVDLAGGAALTGDSLTGVYSVSKGVAALVIAMLIEDGALALDRRVADYWPEFAAAGKGDVTVGDLLSHRTAPGWRQSRPGCSPSTSSSSTPTAGRRDSPRSPRSGCPVPRSATTR